MKPTVKSLIGLSACLMLTSPLQSPADEDPNAGAARCVDLMRIRNVDIVDDRNLLFYMKDGKIYHNQTKHACLGLSVEKRFMYSVPMHQLCNVDLITVLEDRGFGFERGASCGLGLFQPVTKAAADQLKAAAKRQ